ncbi:conserved hypothetical protein [Pyrenophora tritici-repentis Pt-1C-BFP]|uniref:Uncharacterized protein n=1 Tax=Pyrenophora tritici-repentis (strain Pt-1C-BFP) TaxID=426418 RepID=B2W7C2_PYRTR|nr:uncharacterized protein PTRG_05710 [Pyrenophora tritici-repentis Pt-1C-BFP]EDU48630.1 conserved hypothetical protein [Pyrenophora tritici-repentis Pt-1C-BFP]
MKGLFSFIAKNRPKTFTVSYSPDYKNLILNHVASDPSHPLHETQLEVTCSVTVASCKVCRHSRRDEGHHWGFDTCGEEWHYEEQN